MSGSQGLLQVDHDLGKADEQVWAGNPSLHSSSRLGTSRGRSVPFGAGSRTAEQYHRLNLAR